jgi:hypothetical protein
VTRAVGAAVMMMLGGACLRLVVGGGYVDYVKEQMYLPLLASGVILFGLGLVGLLRETSPNRSGGHGAHGHGEPRVAWLLLVPVLAVYLVPPPALGADSIARGGSRVTEPVSPYGPLPEGDVVDLTVREFVERSVYDTTDALVGRQVRLTGFAVPAGERAEGGEYAEAVPLGGEDAAFTLARVSMFCCAADGYAFTVDVTGTDVRPPEDSWVTVTGELVPFEDAPDAYSVPVMQVSEVVPLERPANVYE